MRNITIIKLEARPLSKGHQAHRSGAGKHLDRRTKRNRTRAAQMRFAMKGY